MVRKCSPQTAATAISTSSSPRLQRDPQHSSLTQSLRNLVRITTIWEIAARIRWSVCGVYDYEIQMHEGYGYADEFDVHRHWRDSRLNTLGEGTSEIMRLIISKNIIKGMK